jgi:hypothetical protein
MRSQSEKMTDLFEAQFEEQPGYDVYRRIPFFLPKAGGELPYLVSAAERAGFVADFRRDAPVILRRMVNDIVIAVISFIATNFLAHVLLGASAENVEIALLLVHLGVVIVVENRRLHLVWDAPLRAMAGRAPAPYAARSGSWLKTLLKRMDGYELVLGSVFGLLAAAYALSLVAAPREPGTSALDYFGRIAMCSGMFALGILFAAELVERLRNRFRG